METTPLNSNTPADSPEGTTIPRHIAAVLDNVLSMIVAVVAAKQLPDDQPALQIVTMVIAYLAYYFICELAFSSTPAKLMNGLVVRNFDGGRCSVGQTTIRTLMRLIEVNPILLGGMPAAASILWSRNKQRFGDKVAGTVVVRR
ncbi:RDD family protein [Novipirellula sp. SH528]|uniref:RDD family protein n=1 Tax=Novipirellula sp. SH528 TaxID=3454466 RepID=UPI003F9F8206